MLNVRLEYPEDFACAGNLTETAFCARSAEVLILSCAGVGNPLMFPFPNRRLADQDPLYF
jgi:hypothetical protein